ncbi:MAG TPA: hypothetical protein VN738_00925 [Acidothermaceae bacterium]|jgi:hypothetical protein|nr:hypothetical protein [Acidothermaceae bacterium]HXT46079.1 hypothetical protein [Pseudonocardiaceae bacterium]
MPDRVRRQVVDKIATHEPTAVLAHSLESMVTYESLWTHPERLPA